MQTSLPASKDTAHKSAGNCLPPCTRAFLIDPLATASVPLQTMNAHQGNMPPEQLAANSKHLQLGQPLQPAQGGDAVVLVAEHLYVTLTCTQKRSLWVQVGCTSQQAACMTIKRFTTMQHCYLGGPHQASNLQHCIDAIPVQQAAHLQSPLQLPGSARNNHEVHTQTGSLKQAAAHSPLPAGGTPADHAAPPWQASTCPWLQKWSPSSRQHSRSSMWSRHSRTGSLLLAALLLLATSTPGCLDSLRIRPCLAPPPFGLLASSWCCSCLQQGLLLGVMSHAGSTAARSACGLWQCPPTPGAAAACSHPSPVHPISAVPTPRFASGGACQQLLLLHLLRGAVTRFILAADAL